MTFHSILFERIEDGIKKETLEAPIYFADLNLDQIIDAITAGKQEYNLKPFFYTPLKDADSVKYRHEIMQDLENEAIFENVNSFARKMRAMREHVMQAERLYYKHEKESWFLSAVEIYCDAVTGLAHDLTTADLKSHGFLAFREYVTNYAKSNYFVYLLTETEKVKADLSAVKYCVLINDDSFTVSKYKSEIDYSADVEAAFAKFKQGAVKDYGIIFKDSLDMNHIEAKIVEFVARLYPAPFLNLDNYCRMNADYLDETIAAFDREVQFYMAYLDFIALFKHAGLKFCYPNVSDQCKEGYDREGFDLALAYSLISEGSSVVCNDFYLKDKERIFVVSGPNQGGKTTFARTFGQLHYLAAMGCPVPGSDARLFLFDRIFTHFEREEDITNLRGKLQDDLIRIHDILNRATPNSIIIMNEIFTSTTLKDQIFLSKKIIEKIIQSESLCVWVTFIDDLASFGEQTVSMVSMVVPHNPTLRTYKIERRPADGLAYAMSIAEKYRLTYDCLKERIGL